MIALAFLVVFYPAMAFGLALGLLIGALALGAQTSTTAVEFSAARAGNGPSDFTSRSRSALSPGSAHESEWQKAPDGGPARVTFTADTLAASDPAGATAHLRVALDGVAASERDDPLPARSVPARVASLRAVLIAVDRAAREFGQHPGLMVGVTFCESSLDHSKVGPAGEIGAMQFLGATFARYGAELGYAPEHIHDLTAQARTAAYMWSLGEAKQWSCWRAMR